MIAALAGAWHAAWRTLAFGWRLGAALVLAAVGFLVGVLGGEIALGLLAVSTGIELPRVAREVTIGLVAFGCAGLAFAGRLLGPATASDVMGSARWATRRELRTALAATAIVRDRAALLVGRGHRGELLRYAGPAHLMTIAPTRSGKGVGTVLPNLLARSSAWTRRAKTPALPRGHGGTSGRSSCWTPSAPQACPPPATTRPLPSTRTRPTWPTMPPPSPTHSSTTRRARSRRRTGTRRPRR